MNQIEAIMKPVTFAALNKPSMGNTGGDSFDISEEEKVLV